MIRIRFERRGHDKFEWVYRAYKSFDGQGVTVGIHPDKDNRKVTKAGRIQSNSTLAMMHEYGIGVPERSFFRKALGGRAPGRIAIGIVFREMIPRVLRGSESAESTNHRIGRLMVQAVRDVIDAGVPPPNASETVKRKGHDLTLRETWQMYDALDYKVMGSNGRYRK